MILGCTGNLNLCNLACYAQEGRLFLLGWFGDVLEVGWCAVMWKYALNRIVSSGES